MSAVSSMNGRRATRRSLSSAFCGKSGIAQALPPVGTCSHNDSGSHCTDCSRQREAPMKTILRNQKNKINTQDIRLHVQFAFTREEKPAAS
jgi:hypothetical protein